MYVSDQLDKQVHEQVEDKYIGQQIISHLTKELYQPS